MLELFLSKRPPTWQTRSTETIQLGVILGVEEIYRHSIGSFACVIFVPNYGLVAFRDPHGIKPLAMGWRITTNGDVDYMFASESAPLQSLGYSFLRDVKPGEEWCQDLVCITC